MHLYALFHECKTTSTIKGTDAHMKTQRHILDISLGGTSETNRCYKVHADSRQNATLFGENVYLFLYKTQELAKFYLTISSAVCDDRLPRCSCEC